MPSNGGPHSQPTRKASRASALSQTVAALDGGGQALPGGIRLRPVRRDSERSAVGHQTVCSTLPMSSNDISRAVIGPIFSCWRRFIGSARPGMSTGISSMIRPGRRDITRTRSLSASASTGRGDQEGGLPFLRHRLGQILLEHHLGLGVERREGLVDSSTQHVRVHHHGPGERRALAHAAGEFVRIVVGEAIQMVAVQEFLRPLLALGRVHAADFLAELDIPADRPPGQQQVFLEHKGDMLVRAADRLAVDENLAFRGPVEAGRQVEQGALAAAARPDQGDDLAILDVDADALDREHALAPGPAAHRRKKARDLLEAEPEHGRPNRVRRRISRRGGPFRP